MTKRNENEEYIKRQLRLVAKVCPCGRKFSAAAWTIESGGRMFYISTHSCNFCREPMRSPRES